MAGLSKGLGKGLGALFIDEDEQAEGYTEQSTDNLTKSIDALIPNPKQPRKEFDANALEELSASIRTQGILQPVLVRPVGGSNPQQYEIVAGERRWRAARKAGLTEIPVIIKELSDKETLAIALIENLQREDLSALEEALGMQQLKNEFGLSQEDLAVKLGKSRSAIANTLRLLHLSNKAQEALKQGKITAGHARAILSFPEVKQDEILERILKEKLSVRAVEGIAAQEKEENTVETPEEKTSEDKAQKKKPQSAIMVDIQTKLTQAVQMPVKISGQEDKGKISISYTNKDELIALMQRFGVN